LIIVALQEDATDSRLIAAFQNALSEDYPKVVVAEAMGVGLTTFTKGTRRGLRMAVFARDSLTDLIVGEPQFCAPSQTIATLSLEGLVRGKGGVSVQVVTPKGKLSLINMHLPFDSGSLGTPERPKAVQFQLACMDQVYKAVLDKAKPDYILTMGDLNFRAPDATWTFEDAPWAVAGEIPTNYHEHDELVQYRLNVDNTFQEGVDGGGIAFWPTCKMCASRTPGCVPQTNPCKACQAKAKAGECEAAVYSKTPWTSTKGSESCYAPERAPSWCDRILYSSNVRCIAYDRYDEGSINLSDHAAVWGLFELQ
jgi:hypothetical protein